MDLLGWSGTDPSKYNLIARVRLMGYIMLTHVLKARHGLRYGPSANVTYRIGPDTVVARPVRWPGGHDKMTERVRLRRGGGMERHDKTAGRSDMVGYDAGQGSRRRGGAGRGGGRATGEGLDPIRSGWLVSVRTLMRGCAAPSRHTRA